MHGRHREHSGGFNHTRLVVSHNVTQVELASWLVVNISPWALLRLGVVLTLISLTWLLVTMDDEPSTEVPKVKIGPSVLLTFGIWFLGNVIGYASAFGW